MKNEAAVALGKLRANTITSEQTRAAVMARWGYDRPRCGCGCGMTYARAKARHPRTAFQV